MYKERIERAKILLEALPYIRKFYGKIFVIKYGGSLMEDEHLRSLFANDIVLLKYIGINPVIVHGGGKEISKWIKKVGKEPVFLDGLRYTDDETMEVTEMVLSGKINNEVVSLINMHGGKAVGLSGKSANLLKAEKIKTKDGQDLGKVGNITGVNVDLLKTVTQDGFIPVVSSVGITEEFETLNINADHAAAKISEALKAQKLIYLTDVQGILKDKELINYMNLKEAKELLKHPDIKGGMIPKLECSIEAVESGAENVHIINGTIEHAVLLEIFTDVGIGTMISKEKR